MSTDNVIRSSKLSDVYTAAQCSDLSDVTNALRNAYHCLSIAHAAGKPVAGIHRRLLSLIKRETQLKARFERERRKARSKAEKQEKKALKGIPDYIKVEATLHMDGSIIAFENFDASEAKMQAAREVEAFVAENLSDALADITATHIYTRFDLLMHYVRGALGSEFRHRGLSTWIVMQTAYASAIAFRVLKAAGMETPTEEEAGNWGHSLAIPEYSKGYFYCALSNLGQKSNG